MSKRNFSMQAYWDQKAEEWTPLLAFRGRTAEDYAAWKAAALPKLLELLGNFPAPVDPHAETEYTVEEDGLIRERVVFDVEEGMSVPCILLRPQDLPPDGKGAAILCSHGHGAFGKDPIAGVRSTPAHTAFIEEHNHNYAYQVAKAGFVTLTPDLRGFGERKDGIDPFPGRDRCNVNFIKGALLGVYTLTLNIWDMKCCVDYLQSRPEVDPARIGMMGLSQGGTMTAFTAAVEPRIQAANICGYGGSWAAFAINRANFCGAQMVPGIFRYFDLPDLFGLIAPRPLLLDMGIYDDNFTIGEMLKGAERVEAIYAAAGAAGLVERDVHPHGHAFGGNKAAAFFRNYL